MGKSILLKSLYHTLGADSSFDKNFDEQNVLFSLEFDYGVNRYQFLRFKNAFSILKNGKLSDFIKAKSRTDLSRYFKSEFGLSVYLKTERRQPRLLLLLIYSCLIIWIRIEAGRKIKTPFLKNSGAI